MLRKTGLRVLNDSDLHGIAGGYDAGDEMLEWLQTLISVGACGNRWSNVPDCEAPSRTGCGSA